MIKYLIDKNCLTYVLNFIILILIRKTYYNLLPAMSDNKKCLNAKFSLDQSCETPDERLHENEDEVDVLDMAQTLEIRNIPNECLRNRKVEKRVFNRVQRYESPIEWLHWLRRNNKGKNVNRDKEHVLAMAQTLEIPIERQHEDEDEDEEPECPDQC